MSYKEAAAVSTVPGRPRQRDELLRIAQQAKEILLAYDRYTAGAQRILRHGDNVQTSLDKEIDKYLQRSLPTVCDVAVVSEEAEFVNASMTEFFWLIDPVDGTINEISGTNDWAVSVALIERATMRPIIGIVNVPLHAEIFVAVAGYGAQLNGAPLVVSAPRRNVRGFATPIVSFGIPAHISAISERMGKALVSIMRKGWVTRQTGSAALDICRVARGSWNAFFEYELMYWDVAAAVLIAREAGCQVALPRVGRLGQRDGLSRPCDVLVATSKQLVAELGKITTISEPAGD